MKTTLTEIEYCTCLFLFLNKHGEYSQLWVLSDYMDPDSLEFFYNIPDAKDKIEAMENDFVQFVKTIDTQQLFWDIAWKFAQAKVYALKTCRNSNTQWVAKELDMSENIVHALRTVLDNDELMN